MEEVSIAIMQRTAEPLKTRSLGVSHGKTTSTCKFCLFRASDDFSRAIVM